MTEATEHACMHAKPVEKEDFPMDLELVGSLGIFLPNVVICRRGNWVPERPRLLFREEDGLAGWGWGWGVDGEGGTRHMNLQSRPVLSCSRRAGVGGLTEVANSKLIASEDFDMDPCHVVLPKPKSLSIIAGICPRFLLCLMMMPLKTHIQRTPQRPSIYPTPL